MAKSYIHELGDRLSKNSTAENLPGHIKEIAPVMYNDGNNNYASIQSALNGKASTTHTHGNITNGGTLTDTAAAAAGNDYVVIRDADNAKIQTSTIKGTDVADAVNKKHSHSTLTLSTTAQAYDGSHTLALPSTDPYTSARTPSSHASSATTYGVGTTANYGHVKLATGDMNGATHADGVAVSKNHTHSQYLPKSGGAMTGAITRDLGSGVISDTNLLTVTGSTDGFKVDYGAATSDVGVTKIYTTDDANAKISIGNYNSSYKEAIGITNGSAALSNTPTAPTAAAGTNTTQIATTAFVTSAVSTSAAKYVPLAGNVRIDREIYGYFPSTRDTMVGFEYNCFMNAKNRNVFTFTQSGTGQLTTNQVWALFNGAMEPQYSSTGIDPADPYILTLELSKYTSHTQAFVAFGWTCRYWWPTKFKVEAYNTYNSANTWVTLCDYSTTAVQLPTLIIPFGSGRVNPHTGTTISGSFTKFRITIYQGSTSDNNKWGISEIFYYHPEAYTCFYGLNTFSSDRLATARSLAVSLSNTSTSTTFNGTADVTNIKVSGTLGVGNGGTGATTKKAAEYAINGGMSEATAAMADNFQIVFSRVGTDQNATNGVFIYRQASTVWNYIKSKLSSDTGVNISGNAATATTATKLGSSTLGSGTKPIYLSSGTATECSTYAGGTAVTLNGTSKSATTASFYAPTGAGTSGQLLKSSGSGAPTWATANAALVGITVTSTSVSDGTNTFNKYTHPTYTAQSAKGSATKVPQITTDSTGHVTGITEVTITGVTPASHTHGNISNTGTLTDTAAAAAGNDYVVIRDADNAKVQTSTIKGTDVADAVSKKHSHSTLTLSTTAQAYDGTHTLALPSADPYTSARTPASHTHGNITNGGALQTTDVTIASGDKLVITDSSDSNKVARASISFDGSTATKALTQKGTWETFNNYTHPAYTATAAAAKKIGCDATGHVVFGDALAKGDVGLGSVVNTGDSATPVSGGTTKFTTGGAYTELAKKANVAESVYYVAGTTSYAAWAASTAYAVNAEVTYSGKAYYCKTAHTSGSSWDSSKWTAIATPVLKGTVSGVTALYAGMKIAYKWPITGGTSSTYLNINNLGNVYIRRNDSNTTTHLPANTVSILTYDGTYWRWADYDSNSNTEYIIPDAYCSTAAGTAAKAATCAGFNLANHVNVPFRIYFTAANTSAGALTLSLNSQTAKPIYINGTASSAANYTIPIGVYWCVYDGTEFLLWTDKRFTGRTQGDGRNLLSAFNYSAARFTATNPSDDINGASYTHIKTSGDSYIQIKATEPITTGDMLTLSFDVSGLNTSGNEYVAFLAYALNKVITHTINKNGRCVYYFTKTETADITTGSVVNILDDNTNIYTTAPSGITISNIKLERGFVADPKYTRHPSESRVSKAEKIATSAKIGDTNKPVYIAADGTVTAGSTYAAGTAVTLNGTSKSASTASFYAPTGAGTSGQLLKSSGSGAPTWATANAALVGITVTSSSVSDGTNTFNKYTHPTTSGNKHVPSGGSSGQFLGWDSDGTAKWVANPNTDTKNTAGSTDTSSKIFLIGATSQAANPQTYSQDTTYVDTDATLASTKVRVAEKCTLQFNATTNALDFVFA